MTDFNIFGFPIPPSDASSLDDYLEAYLGTLGAIGRNIQTIRGYRKRLTDFCSWVANQGIDSAAAITTADITDYCGRLSEANGYKPATMNAVLTSIRAYFSWLCEEGWLSDNPAESLHGVPRDTAPRWLDKNERYRVIRTAKAEDDERNKLVILTLLLSGMRGDELLNLRPDDVIIGAGEGTFVIRGDYPRMIPIHKQLQQPLGKYIIEERAMADWVFGSQRSEKLTIRGLQHICKQIGEKAGVRDLSPQVLRHTFGHDMVTARVSAYQVMSMLGARYEAVTLYLPEAHQKALKDPQSAVELLNPTKEELELEEST